MITVNAMGDACPIPVVKTKQAISTLSGPEVIEVLVDNEVAVNNVSKLGTSSGAAVSAEKLGEGEYKVILKFECVGGECSEAEAAVTGDTIVVINSNLMGSGNDALGKVLMKGFIFAITQLDKLPTKMIFYNGGATLTVEGSDSLEDLKKLEAEGVEIMTCGTCLDYYQVKDKLAVGSITNMYSIVENMAKAGKVIRP